MTSLSAINNSNISCIKINEENNKLANQIYSEWAKKKYARNFENIKNYNRFICFKTINFLKYFLPYGVYILLKRIHNSFK